MKTPSEQTDKVLDLIYDAAAENELWCSALTAIADLTGSQGGILFGVSFAQQKIFFDFNGRLNEDCNRAYQERHMKNPWASYMEHQPVGRLVQSDEIIDISELRSSAFYDEVLRPQNVAHNGMMALAARDDFRAAFNICRSAQQGPLGPDETRILESLTPHLRRSMLLGFRLDGYRNLQRLAFDALDQLADGVVILDRRSHVIFANTAARTYEASGVLDFRGRMSLVRRSQRLTDLIGEALQGKPGGCMSVPRDDHGQRLTIIVSSIRGKDIGRFADAALKDAAVLLFVIDPANRKSVSLTSLRDAYGLTLAEARVALASVSGNTMTETASLLALSPNTVKTHLRHVFAKTDTSRQAELSALIASIGATRLSHEPSD